MERELGELRWLVAIAATHHGFSCEVAVTFDNLLIESHGDGFDGVSAAWDALSAAEQTLRDLRGARHEPDHLAAS